MQVSATEAAGAEGALPRTVALELRVIELPLHALRALLRRGNQELVALGAVSSEGERWCERRQTGHADRPALRWPAPSGVGVGGPARPGPACAPGPPCWTPAGAASPLAGAPARTATGAARGGRSCHSPPARKWRGGGRRGRAARRRWQRQWRETLAGKHTLALASARWLADEIVAAYRLSAAPTILRIRSCRCFADSARRCIARCTRIMDLACTVANCASASSRTRRFSSMRRRSCWSSARRRRSDSIFSMGLEDVVREWLRVKGVSFSANRFAQSQEALRLAACSSVGRRRKPRSRWRS